MCLSGFHKIKISVFILFISITSFAQSSQSEPLASEEGASVAMSPELDVVRAQYQEVEQERILDALVEAVHKATVSAQTSGRVSKIFFDVNDYVKKGDVLLRMRDKDQQAKLKVAQADYNQAETEFNRVQELHLNKLIAKSAVDKAESQLKSTRARLDQAEENLERTIVRAPYSGIVVKRHIEVGETARTGVPLFTGLSLESLRVAVNLPQDIISAVRQRKTARIFLEQSNKTVSATSMSITPYADEDSHTFLVRVKLPEGDHGLYPGMATKVAFTVGQVRKLLVPISAVAHRSEVAAVYVMNEQQELSLLQVRVGRQVGDDMLEVLSGLQENDLVATDPVKAAIYLKDHISR